MQCGGAAYISRYICSYVMLSLSYFSQIKVGENVWGPYCGEKAPEAISTQSHSVQILFRSDNSGENRGWKLSYRAAGNSPIPHVHMHTCECAHNSYAPAYSPHRAAVLNTHRTVDSGGAPSRGNWDQGSCDFSSIKQGQGQACCCITLVIFKTYCPLTIMGGRLSCFLTPIPQMVSH